MSSKKCHKDCPYCFEIGPRNPLLDEIVINHMKKLMDENAELNIAPGKASASGEPGNVIINQPPQDKTWIEKYDELFNYASFTWNGDNATGVKIAKQTLNKNKAFISSLLSKQRTALLDRVEEYIDKNGFRDSWNLDAIYTDKLKELLSTLRQHSL